MLNFVTFHDFRCMDFPIQSGAQNMRLVKEMTQKVKGGNSMFVNVKKNTSSDKLKKSPLAQIQIIAKNHMIFLKVY